ncbi:hypothetical protein ROZALSC1DRAFT_28579 [Rozella allomycis CSF55]|uniref:Uncharacterized protein n=1 Tax=Rozella allomycis (strain CSF55) TaxID=988480 RepID=A0A075AVA4_ROZAC|nr:hypothetical protein O9G_004060 [Rozella allomycis CSF55]RKP19867.1 hypothetical protein ROZALSC1DRAFT_28579 [Rozella allomycis CSF55]|eukprot:EPZ34183.1 hypothetical protein O9G_004060 [Rozella allomycis CSF55]
MTSAVDISNYVLEGEMSAMESKSVVSILLTATLDFYASSLDTFNEIEQMLESKLITRKDIHKKLGYNIYDIKEFNTMKDSLNQIIENGLKKPESIQRLRRKLQQFHSEIISFEEKGQKDLLDTTQYAIVYVAKAAWFLLRELSIKDPDAQLVYVPERNTIVLPGYQNNEFLDYTRVRDAIAVLNKIRFSSELMPYREYFAFIFRYTKDLSERRKFDELVLVFLQTFKIHGPSFTIIQDRIVHLLKTNFKSK